MVIAAQRYLLGIRSELDGLVIDPCIPKDWKTITINREYQGKKLQITIENTSGVTKGVKWLKVNGDMIDGNFITKEFIVNQRDDVIKIIAQM